LVQNFAPALRSAPQDLQPVCEDRIIIEGSGEGKVPGEENASPAETIDGGLPGV
jgi:hypothetical protein